MDLDKVIIYRITHIKNIPHILQYGITHRDSPNKNHNFVNIGDLSLIDTRRSKQIRVDNGEYSSDNIETIVLGDYIPFYFGIRMPMLYVAQHGGNFVEKAHSPENIVYIACSLKSIILNGNKLYFTDGHATDNFTTFYNKDKITELVKIIDWKAVKSVYWGGEENLDLKRKKQAELLVSGDISPKHIVGFGCFNEKAKNTLISLGVLEDKIKIIRDAYY